MTEIVGPSPRVEILADIGDRCLCCYRPMESREPSSFIIALAPVPWDPERAVEERTGPYHRACLQKIYDRTDPWVRATLYFEHKPGSSPEEVINQNGNL